MNFLLMGCSFLAAFVMQKDALVSPRCNIFDHPENVQIELLRYEGGRHRWSAAWLAIGETAPAALLRGLDDMLRTEGRWTRQADAKGSLQTRWTFTDENGEAWNARSWVSPFSGQRDIHTVRLEIWDK